MLPSFYYKWTVLRIGLVGGDQVKKLKLCAAVLALSAILLQPEAAVQGGQTAMRIWVNSVAPALFPFLVLMPVLTGQEACMAYRRIFAGIMQKLFHLPGEAAPAVIIGMLSGAPGGAMAVNRIAARAGMSRADACRLALSVCGLSPAYLVLGVGQGIYGSAHMGAKLALIQATIQLGFLFLLRGVFDEQNGIVEAAAETENVRPVREAVEVVMIVCGYMVFFSSITNVAVQLLGGNAGRLLLALSDLPSGMAALAGWNVRWSIFAQGAALGFGGMCIAVQNLDALRGCGVRVADYFAVKLSAAAIFACAAGLCCNGGSSAESYVNPEFSYAVSLLFAMLAVLPLLFYLTNTFFLNKRKAAEKWVETRNEYYI